MTSVPGSVLVAGAINTDLVATVTRAPLAGETVTGSGFAIHGGGKGANQAVAVARSGGRALLLGAIGNDDFGRARLDDLMRDGVETGSVMTCADAPSGVALILVEEGGENRIAYVPGATLMVPQSHAIASFAAIEPSFILATNELPHDTLRALFQAARGAGAAVAFNATPDPAMAGDLVRDVAILIVNEGEAAALLGLEALGEPGQAVAALLALGPETVVLTVGADGAHVGTSDGVQWHRPPQVTVRDTTGAGDTFCGAFMAEIARGVEVHDAARFAVIASAISVTRFGAQSSIPTREEITAWQARGAGSA